MNFERLLGPLVRRIQNLLARGNVTGVDSSGKTQRLQLGLMAGEAKDRVEHFEPFGWTSHAKVGAEHLTVFLDGDRSHGVTVVVADKRYRLQGLAEGEVAMHDAQGNYIWFKADGSLAMKSALKIAIDSPLITTTGDFHAAGTITGDVDVIAAGKSGKTHTHPNGTPNTGTPN
jgi:phage baseplate assembly protein V